LTLLVAQGRELLALPAAPPAALLPPAAAAMTATMPRVAAMAAAATGRPVATCLASAGAGGVSRAGRFSAQLLVLLGELLVLAAVDLVRHCRPGAVLLLELSLPRLHLRLGPRHGAGGGDRDTRSLIAHRGTKSGANPQRGVRERAHRQERL